MSQSSGFDISKLSTPTKILLGAGILYFIDLFLPWQRVCIGGFCGSVGGTHGFGALNLILALALIVWEGLAFSSVKIAAPRALISAGLAAAILVFTILKILVDNDFIYLFAWVGLILALAIGYGGWMRWQEHQAGAGATGGGGGGAIPPPPTGGGFTS